MRYSDGRNHWQMSLLPEFDRDLDLDSQVTVAMHSPVGFKASPTLTPASTLTPEPHSYPSNPNP